MTNPNTALRFATSRESKRRAKAKQAGWRLEYDFTMHGVLYNIYSGEQYEVLPGNKPNTMKVGDVI